MRTVSSRTVVLEREFSFCPNTHAHRGYLQQASRFSGRWQPGNRARLEHARWAVFACRARGRLSTRTHKLRFSSNFRIKCYFSVISSQSKEKNQKSEAPRASRSRSTRGPCLGFFRTRLACYAQCTRRSADTGAPRRATGFSSTEQERNAIFGPKRGSLTDSHRRGPVC